MTTPSLMCRGLLTLAFVPTLGATLIDLSTGSANWLASGGGATNQTAYVIGPVVSVTSTAGPGGTFLPGGSIANFDGFWTASLSFFLPSDASNVVLTYAALWADDRVVLELNGNIIGSGGILGPGAGQMTFTDGGSNDPFAFAANFSSGSTSSGFIVGAVNTLTAIVNNTGAGISGAPITVPEGDFTDFGLIGEVSYTPEPGSAMLLLAGAGLLTTRRRSRY